MNAVGNRYAGDYWYRLRACLIPECMNTAPWEYLWPRRGIASRSSFDGRLDHRRRVGHGAASRDAIHRLTNEETRTNHQQPAGVSRRSIVKGGVCALT
jgi:hypothetical protein